MHWGNFCFLGVFLQRGDLYTPGQITESLDTMIQVNHAETANSQPSQRGQLGLGSWQLQTVLSQNKCWAPLQWVQSYSPILCKALNELFIPLFKKKNQLGQWTRIVFACKIITNTGIWRQDCYQMNNYCSFILCFSLCIYVHLMWISQAMKYAYSTKYVDQDFSKE